MLCIIIGNMIESGICSRIDIGKKNGLVDTGIIYNMIGDKKNLAQFLLQKDGMEHIEADASQKDDIWALQTIQDALNVTSGMQI